MNNSALICKPQHKTKQKKRTEKNGEPICSPLASWDHTRDIVNPKSATLELYCIELKRMEAWILLQYGENVYQSILFAGFRGDNSRRYNPGTLEKHRTSMKNWEILGRPIESSKYMPNTVKLNIGAKYEFWSVPPYVPWSNSPPSQATNLLDVLLHHRRQLFVPTVHLAQVLDQQVLLAL